MKQLCLSNLTVNVQADALGALLDGGFVDVMTAPKPDSSDEKIKGQTVLVTMQFGKPAFVKSMDGTIRSNPMAPGIGRAFGDPTWFRAYTADHKSVFDGSAGTTDANMILAAKTIVPGVTVGCSGIEHTVIKKETHGNG